jgi:phage N-6-adenine-methyltransferase
LAEDRPPTLHGVHQYVRDGHVRGTEGTGEFERNTPAEYIASARSVLGAIDLDPASNAQAQRIVKAARYFTIKDDGLAHPWRGRVWLNPPYHRGLLPAFVDKLLEEVEAERVVAAVMLTNNCTDTAWFARAQATAAAICFTTGRISFLEPGGRELGVPPQGQAFFYFGPEVARFAEVFRRIGFLVRPWRHGGCA